MKMGKFDLSAVAGRSLALGGGIGCYYADKIPGVQSLNPEVKGLVKAGIFALLPEVAGMAMKNKKAMGAVEKIALGGVGAAGFEYVATKFGGNTISGPSSFKIDEDYMMNGLGDKRNDVMDGISNEDGLSGLGDHRNDVL